MAFNPTQRRVQVRDLSRPEEIRPAPIQRSLYSRAPKPVVDTSKYENLVSALGIAKQLVGPLASQLSKGQAEASADAKKAHIEDITRQWNVYLSSTEESQVLEDLRSGKAARFWEDPYIGAAVRKHHGFIESAKLAREISKEMEEEKVPLGDPSFVPEKYILDKAKGYVDRLGGNKEVIQSFRKGMDKIRDRLSQKHDEALNKAQNAHIESIAHDYLSASFDEGIESGLSGVEILDQIRKKVYPDIGPRFQGGSLDINRGRLDEILLDVAREKAEDPKTAEAVMTMLKADRKDRNGSPLPSLAKTHKQQASRIIKRATHVLGASYEAQVEHELLQNDVKKLYENDGSFFNDFEAPNKFIPGKSITVSGSDRRKQALKAVAAAERLKHTGSLERPVPSEISLYIKNGHKHEEIAANLNGAVNGFLNLNLDASGKEAEERGKRLEKIVAAAEVWGMITSQHPGTANWVDKRTREFFENYTEALAGMNQGDPIAAAETAHRLYTQGDVSVSVPSTELDTALSGLDNRMKGYFSNTANFGQVRREVKAKAERYMKLTGADARTALDRAVAETNKTAITVNGRTILNDPYLTREDEPLIEKAIDAFYDQYKRYLDDMDLEADDISVVRNGFGDYQFVEAETGQTILIPSEGVEIELKSPEERAELAQLGVEETADLAPTGPKGFSFEVIQKLREARSKDVDSAIDKSIDRRLSREEQRREVNERLDKAREQRRQRELNKLKQNKDSGFNLGIGE